MTDHHRTLVLQGRPRQPLRTLLNFVAISAGVIAVIVAAPYLIADATPRMLVTMAALYGAFRLRRRQFPPTITAQRSATEARWRVRGEFHNATVGVGDDRTVIASALAQDGGVQLTCADGSTLRITPDHFEASTLREFQRLLESDTELDFSTIPVAADAARTRLQRHITEKAQFLRWAERPSFLVWIIVLVAIEVVCVVVIPRG
jgi:hypothetical protein